MSLTIFRLGLSVLKSLSRIQGRYIMPEIDEVQAVDIDSYEDRTELHREIFLVGQNRKLDWMMSRNYTFIPYQTLSDYQKALVRRTLEAKRMYRKTGTSLQMHEQSVRAVKGMIEEIRDMGVYRKTGGQQTRQSLKQKEPEQQIEMAKKLMEEYGLSAESPKNTLLYLGLGYGLSESAIRSYLGMK